MKDLETGAMKWMDVELRKRILSRNLVPAANLQKAEDLARETDDSLFHALITLGQLTKQQAYEEIAGIYGVPYIDLETYIHDPGVVALISEKNARELEVFPLFTIGNSLTVAVADPGNITVLDRVAALSGKNVDACLAARDDIHKAINRTYGTLGEVKEFLETMDKPEAAQVQDGAAADARAEEAPVSKLVSLILEQAIRDKASDVHIDPEEHSFRVRFRVDGILHEIPPPPKHLYPFIISRLKVMSNMDIAESRIPQDGAFRLVMEGRTVDARVSTVPTVHGENMVIRLLDAQTMGIELDDLGFSEMALPSVEGLIHRPHGMVVVTGPTGSGKTTTLYAVLSCSRSSERHVITVEDPVERRMELVSQIQVNEKAGVTFAGALRSMLRQDPDIMMVGEIRDQETAQLAIRAALTGHLVFSSLHTNDAIGAVMRLTNMGIEPYLVASSLSGVIAQRLARKICDECKQSYTVPDAVRRRLAHGGIELPGNLWMGRGCSACRNTGYRGRIAVFEVLVVSPELSDMIASRVSPAQMKAHAVKAGMASLLEDGMRKAKQGITSVEEVLRVAELEMAVEAGKDRTMEVRSTPVPVATTAPVVENASLDIENYRQKVSSWLARPH